MRENLLDFYFKLSHFLDIYERQDENYVKYTRMCEDGSFELKLFCVNPRENLKECMLRGRSTILFSATFLPIQYYKNLLGGEKEDYEVYAHSVFDPEKQHNTDRWGCDQQVHTQIPEGVLQYCPLYS